MSDWWTLVLVSVPLLVLWAGALLEVARRRDLRARSRLVWIAAILFLPLLGLAAYIVARPPRALRVSGTDGGNERALELVVLAERHQRGGTGDDRPNADQSPWTSPDHVTGSATTGRSARRT